MPRLGGALDIVQVADPASPAAGRQYLYFKSNGLLYSKKSDGTVTQIGAASGTTTIIDGGATPSEAYDGITVTSGAGAFDGAYSSLSGVPSSFTPSLHAASHASGGGDPLTLAISQITNLSTELASKFSGTNKPAASDLSATGTRDSTTFLRGDNTWAAPPGGGSSPVTVYDITADQAFTTTTLADITDWVIPLPANEVVSLDAILVFSSAATTTGFQFAATPRTVGNGGAITPSRFLVIFEYQTSATAWATFTQTVPTTPMTLVTASYVANSGIMCRITGQIEMGATAGELHMQARTEIASSAITVRRGSPLRVM